MVKIVAIMAGGAAGALMRYIIFLALQTKHPGIMPWGTLAVNLSGSLLIGLLAAVFLKFDVSQAWRLFLFVGFLGSFTTFSAFSLETTALIRQSHYWSAAIYVLVSNIGGIALAAAGWYLMGIVRQ